MGYAEDLKRQLHKLDAEEVLTDVALPVPELGEDFVFHFKARRVDMSQAIMTGQLPEHISLVFLNAVTQDKENGAANAAKQLTPAEQMQFIALQRATVRRLCADPILVEKSEEGPGEVSMFSLPPALITALYMYAMTLSPAVPVEMVNGSTVQVADIESFRSAEPNV